MYFKYVLPCLSLPSSLALIIRIQNGKALNSRVILYQSVCSWMRIMRLRDMRAWRILLIFLAALFLSFFCSLISNLKKCLCIDFQSALIIGVVTRPGFCFFPVTDSKGQSYAWVCAYGEKPFLKTDICPFKGQMVN